MGLLPCKIDLKPISPSPQIPAAPKVLEPLASRPRLLARRRCAHVAHVLIPNAVFGDHFWRVSASQIRVKIPNCCRLGFELSNAPDVLKVATLTIDLCASVRCSKYEFGQSPVAASGIIFKRVNNFSSESHGAFPFGINF